MRTLPVAAIVIALFVAAIPSGLAAERAKGQAAQDDPRAPREVVKGARQQLVQLVQEAREAAEAYRKWQAAVQEKGDKDPPPAAKDPSLRLARRALTLARQNPKTATGVLALGFVCACGQTPLNQELATLKTEAIRDLEGNYFDQPWFSTYLPAIAIQAALCDVTPLLRHCLEDSPHREVRAQACLHLANDSLRKQRVLNERGRQLSPAEEREMTALFDRCVREFGELKTANTTIAKAGARSLFEIRNLAVGRPAPAMAGKDLEGKSLALNDYRGKVVMLVFWGNWCGHCRKALPGRQSLAEQFKNRPFVLLGINSDPLETAKKAVEREKITWRCWWDGGDTGGPIATAWNVKTWPTVCLLDRRGIIRFRHSIGVSQEESANAIEQLLAEVP